MRDLIKAIINLTSAINKLTEARTDEFYRKLYSELKYQGYSFSHTP